jgi:hypothetical protein
VLAPATVTKPFVNVLHPYGEEFRSCINGAPDHFRVRFHLFAIGVNQMRNFSQYQMSLSIERESNPHLRRSFATGLILVEGKLARVIRPAEATCTLLGRHIMEARLDSARTSCGIANNLLIPSDELLAFVVENAVNSALRERRPTAPLSQE